MKIILFTIILLASYPLFAKDGKLPQYFDVEEIILNGLPQGDTIEISTKITIPNKHKNRIQNDAFRVFEKIDGKWVKSASLNATPDILDKNLYTVRGKVKLMSSTSEIALDSTIIHCGKYCVINNFQGVTKRNKNKFNNLISLNLKGYLPTDKIKE